VADDDVTALRSQVSSLQEQLADVRSQLTYVTSCMTTLLQGQQQLLGQQPSQSQSARPILTNAQPPTRLQLGSSSQSFDPMSVRANDHL
jgi:uncharacterized protein involved in exopolysaccharide biosynthesis